MESLQHSCHSYATGSCSSAIRTESPNTVILSAFYHWLHWHARMEEHENENGTSTFWSEGLAALELLCNNRPYEPHRRHQCCDRALLTGSLGSLASSVSSRDSLLCCAAVRSRCVNNNNHVGCAPSVLGSDSRTVSRMGTPEWGRLQKHYALFTCSLEFSQMARDNSPSIKAPPPIHPLQEQCSSACERRSFGAWATGFSAADYEEEEACKSPLPPPDAIPWSQL